MVKKITNEEALHLLFFFNLMSLIYFFDIIPSMGTRSF